MAQSLRRSHLEFYLEVSWNGGTPRSSILDGDFPLQTIYFGDTPMAMETSIWMLSTYLDDTSQTHLRRSAPALAGDSQEACWESLADGEIHWKIHWNIQKSMGKSMGKSWNIDESVMILNIHENWWKPWDMRLKWRDNQDISRHHDDHVRKIADGNIRSCSSIWSILAKIWSSTFYVLMRQNCMGR